MKTIYDLVDHLNATFDYADFSISADNKQQFYYIFMTTFTEYGELIEFNQQSKDWDIMPTLGKSNNEIQKEIMDFIYTTDSNYWFNEQEKKYNIIIGKDMSGNFKTVYYKAGNGVDVTDTAGEDELVSDQYQFIESEIEDLKATLSENMAKIVDLGKVEVTNED